jgi:type IV secretory pathway VirB10-like protein
MAPRARTEREAVASKSSNLWPLLTIGAVVILAAIIGIIFMVMRPTPSKQQTAATPPPSAQTPAVKTRTSPAPPPARTSKVTQNTAAQPPRPPKATPAPEKQPSSESESVSAFDRAGSLKRPSEPKSQPTRKPGNEPKSAFDRAGGNIGSDQTKAEPSPDDQ